MSQTLRTNNSPRRTHLARYILTRGIRRCEALFNDTTKAPDTQSYQLAQSLLDPDEEKSKP